jgi:hypothetical protein
MPYDPSLCTAPFLISLLLTYPLRCCCAEYNRNPVRDAYDLETLKGYVNEVGYRVDGIEGIGDAPSPGSVGQAWKDFTAEF